jgi:hypothetical protein
MRRATERLSLFCGDARMAEVGALMPYEVRRGRIRAESLQARAEANLGHGDRRMAAADAEAALALFEALGAADEVARTRALPDRIPV